MLDHMIKFFFEILEFFVFSGIKSEFYLSRIEILDYGRRFLSGI